MKIGKINIRSIILVLAILAYQPVFSFYMSPRIAYIFEQMKNGTYGTGQVAFIVSDDPVDAWLASKEESKKESPKKVSEHSIHAQVNLVTPRSVDLEKPVNFGTIIRKKSEGLLLTLSPDGTYATQYGEAVVKNPSVGILDVKYPDIYNIEMSKDGVLSDGEGHILEFIPVVSGELRKGDAHIPIGGILEIKPDTPNGNYTTYHNGGSSAQVKVNFY